MGHRQPHKPCIIDGKVFASQAEGTRYVQLKGLKEAGEITDFILQPEYPLMSHFRHCLVCGSNQKHIPKSQKKSVVLCQKCGGKTKVVPNMKYVADFLVKYPDGTERIEDVKGSRGYMDTTFVMKWHWFDLFYEGKNIEIVVIPQSEINKIFPPERKKRPAQKEMNEKRRK
jgi:transcription elongation factor Elf1